MYACPLAISKEVFIYPIYTVSFCSPLMYSANNFSPCIGTADFIIYSGEIKLYIQERLTDLFWGWKNMKIKQIKKQ